MQQIMLKHHSALCVEKYRQKLIKHKHINPYSPSILCITGHTKQNCNDEIDHDHIDVKNDPIYTKTIIIWDSFRENLPSFNFMMA